MQLSRSKLIHRRSTKRGWLRAHPVNTRFTQSMYNNLSTCAIVCALAATPLFAQATAPDQLSERRGIEHRLEKLIVAGEEIALPEHSTITLTFLQDNRIAGRGAVNLFFGGYHLADDGALHWAGSGDESSPRFGSTMI